MIKKKSVAEWMLYNKYLPLIFYSWKNWAVENESA
jgi:hypothetical protein